MNAVLATVCTALFFACAPALVAARFAWPKRVSWRAVVLVAALLGWGLVNLVVFFTQAHTSDLVQRAGGLEHAPPELLEKWSRDSGPKAFAIVLGWLTGLVYLLPWLGIYAVFHRVRERRRNASTIAA